MTTPVAETEPQEPVTEPEEPEETPEPTEEPEETPEPAEDPEEPSEPEPAQPEAALSEKEVERALAGDGQRRARATQSQP